MTHTSTEQPEALMKLADDYAEACFDQGLHQRTTDDKPEAAREKLEKELRRLHARVQELEAQTAHMADLVELADYATKKLEASQAQRVPLSDAECDSLIAALCPDFCDERFPGDRPILRQLARDALNPNVGITAIDSRITQEKQG